MEAIIDKYDWSRLNPLQLGRYAEYFVKMEFTLYGFDIYTTEIDDKGINFVVRKDEKRYYDVQVKSIRGLNYIFMHLIPATAWCSPSALCVGHDYEGKKSKPEWGLNLSQKNMPLLEQYKFEQIVHEL